MAALWLLGVLMACGVQYVKGPDGKPDWFKVQCRREVWCAKQASNRCPTGFFLSDPETNATTFSAKAPDDADDNAATKSREMLARCGLEKDESEVSNEGEDEPFKPIQKPKSLAGCGRAFDHIAELQTAWIEWHPDAKSPETEVKRSDFISVCGDLPEGAQNCLSLKYAPTHIEECAATMDNLPQKTRVRLAKLFEKEGDDPKDWKIPQPILDAGPDDAAADAGDAGAKKDGGAPKAGKDAGAAKDAGIPLVAMPKDAGAKAPRDAAAE